MGNAIHNVLAWSSEGSVKLENTPVNDSIIDKILKFVSAFERQHTLESTLVFREPLIWNTTLDRDDLIHASGFHTRYLHLMANIFC